MKYVRVGERDMIGLERNVKQLARLLGGPVLVASLLLSSPVPVVAGEDWAVYMNVSTDPDIGRVPGEGYRLGFGIRTGAGDNFHAGEGDVIAPPDPMAGINAYFFYQANPAYQRELAVSVTGPASSIGWPLVMRVLGETGETNVTISWGDIGNVPARYVVLEIRDAGGNTLADMRSVEHYTFSASQDTTYRFEIRAEAGVAREYELIIPEATGGSVTIAGGGTSSYGEGAVVELVAQAEEGYRFVRWAGDVEAIADVNAASTTITMDGDYTIRPTFEKVPAQRHNWVLIAAIGGVVLVVGLLILRLLRRRRA